ncbi:hypothetical protein DGWBC_1170 [Dehalogenimonas sp. WBC-2]|nr:hypothetical protein DGWBC_1170 [Dehalogenimonas sp. WBC-2]
MRVLCRLAGGFYFPLGAGAFFTFSGSGLAAGLLVKSSGWWVLQ